MEYVRRSRRGAWKSAAMVSYAGDNHAMGEVLDISPEGAAVTVPTALRAGTAVTLLLDPACLPAAMPAGGLPSLQGTITWAKRESTTSARHRIGIRFNALPPTVTQRLDQLTRLTATGAPTPTVERTLAQTHAGREHLYMHAVERMTAHDFVAARLAASWALQAAPRSRELRALVCRIRAEEALAQGQTDAAAREIALGLTLQPDDEAMLALARRVPEPPPSARGVLARIFRRTPRN